jgi:hypothetical protein
MTTYILVIKERQDKEPSIVEVKLTNKEAQIKISDNIGVYRE